MIELYFKTFHNILQIYVILCYQTISLVKIRRYDENFTTYFNKFSFLTQLQSNKMQSTKIKEGVYILFLYWFV